MSSNKVYPGTTLVNQDLGHHEISDDNGDNHEVIQFDRVDAFEAFVDECYGRETSW